MICEELARDACPCILADIGHCRCCSLLMGKEFCQCDYPGFCVYEKHRWEDIQPLSNHDQVVACFPFATCTGIVIRWENSAYALPGLRLTLRQAGREAIYGTVLHTFPDKKLVYLAVTSPMPVPAANTPVDIEAGGNVFGRDAGYIANPDGHSVQIIADNDLLPLLAVLANRLKPHAGGVALTEIRQCHPQLHAGLMIFVSRDHSALRQALKSIPLYSKTRSAFWFV